MEPNIVWYFTDAAAAVAFITRLRDRKEPEGTVDPEGNRKWVALLGDVIDAVAALNPSGAARDMWLGIETGCRAIIHVAIFVRAPLKTKNCIHLSANQYGGASA